MSGRGVSDLLALLEGEFGGDTLEKEADKVKKNQKVRARTPQRRDGCNRARPTTAVPCCHRFKPVVAVEGRLLARRAIVVAIARVSRVVSHPSGICVCSAGVGLPWMPCHGVTVCGVWTWGCWGALGGSLVSAVV